MKNYSKYIIVGAGLSGLTSAYTLLQDGEDDFIILEGRKRVGGRIWTRQQTDMGAAWFQPHHGQLTKLIADLEIDTFKQYTDGRSAFIYSSMAPMQYFENDAESAAFRIAGGSTALIEALSDKCSGKILLDQTVHKIEDLKDQIKITCDHGIYYGQKVILALPPKVAIKIDYQKELPYELTQIMSQTHTWMSNAIKVGLVFRHPFWKESGLSGTIIGHVSPVIELYDHCNFKNDFYGLMGFVNEGLRSSSDLERQERILGYLENHFGSQVRDYVDYCEKDWSADPYTSNKGLNSVYISPQYGHPVFRKKYMSGKLVFSGAETSPIHGGYMDGAVISGYDAVQLSRSN